MAHPQTLNRRNYNGPLGLPRWENVCTESTNKVLCFQAMASWLPVHRAANPYGADTTDALLH